MAPALLTERQEVSELIGILTLALVALSGAAARPAEAPLPTGETIEVAPGERLGLDDRGAGETVLLLPSLSFPAYGFRHVVPRLVDSGHRVLVVDSLGLGRSTQPPSADYSSGAQAGRVARVLEAVARGPVLVVAPSGGSATALRLASARPDLVRAVLALEAGVPEEPMSPGIRRAIRWAPLLKLFGGRRRIRGRLRKTLTERAHDPAWVTEDVVDSYLAYAGKDFDGLMRTYRLFANAREKEPLREHLPRVRCPECRRTSCRGCAPASRICSWNRCRGAGTSLRRRPRTRSCRRSMPSRRPRAEPGLRRSASGSASNRSPGEAGGFTS